MNYHIIKQDKFFNRYIEDVYELGLESNNTFWVRGEEGEKPYLTSTREKVYLGNERAYIVDVLKTIQKEDKLFVSPYDTYIADIIIEANVPCKVYVNMMGYEFYAEPWECHANWLYDRITHHEFEKIGALRTLRYNIPKRNLFKHIIRYLKLPFRRHNLILAKNKTIARIDYISCEKEELSLLKKYYPSLRAELFPTVFCQNFDEASLLPSKCFDDGVYRILVGNSGDPTNNHADAYKYLSNLKLSDDHSMEVYSFLSYGDERGKNWAMQYGWEYLGKNFHPITDFMPISDFLSFMSNIV